ncbi:MAG TPA: glycerophosphoryl diester phosphodiesterase membrane domain-containing protein [Candidatus Microbacterium stercoravium]|uniref:Glycerophosphoryl diester phosphodiesterase membrane domain-containing protein n=1 Tax=Candidatus Microbacterium stercoravium TaxID=2838697 RepID=A0A9D2H7K2_9MICO|nr:glycerophosphoryl diester phosphodiesterase membrane domain-containing protein [Candidatus Microbacterium stercoravium]
MTDRVSQGWTPAPRQGLIPLYPLGFGTILGRSFAVLKGNPRVLLLFVVGVQTLAMVLYMVAIGVITFAAFSRAMTVPEFSPEFDELMAGGTAIVILSSLLLAILLMAVSVIAQGIVVAEVAHASLAEKSRLSVLWRRVRPAFWRLVGYSLLIGLATTVAVAALAAPTILIALIGSPAAYIFAVIVGLLSLAGGAVLYAWLGTKLYLAQPAIVLEGLGPFRAISRSWRLTRGRFWPTFGVLILLFLITNVASSLISSILSIFLPMVMGVLVPLGVAGEDVTAVAIVAGVASILAFVLMFAVASIMTIVIGAGGTLCYIDARMRDEGIDMRMRRYVEAGGGEDPYTYIPDAAPSPYAAGRPHAQPGHPPAQPGYAPQPPGYPPAQPGYAPQPQGYPPAQPGYAPPQGYAPPAQPYAAPQGTHPSAPPQPGSAPGPVPSPDPHVAPRSGDDAAVPPKPAPPQSPPDPAAPEPPPAPPV